LLTCFRTKLIIDWHNYGFSILQVNGRGGCLVSIARFYEFFLGKFGDHHLTVSKAMRKDLNQTRGVIGLNSSVIYDKSTPKFKMSLNIEQK
jgi:beta-1,4-mannosyltransferase